MLGGLLSGAVKGFFKGLLKGVITAVVIVAVVALTVGTAGIGTGVLACLAGGILLAGVSGAADGAKDAAKEDPPPPAPGGGSVCGTILPGSTNVLIENKPAARAGIDHCTHDNVLIAQGSSTVAVNGKPLARLTDKSQCSGTITTSASHTKVGGPPATVVAIESASERNKTLIAWLDWIGKGAEVGSDILFGVAGGVASKMTWLAASVATLSGQALKYTLIGVGKLAHWSAGTQKTLGIIGDFTGNLLGGGWVNGMREAAESAAAKEKELKELAEKLTDEIKASKLADWMKRADIQAWCAADGTGAKLKAVEEAAEKAAKRLLPEAMENAEKAAEAAIAAAKAQWNYVQAFNEMVEGFAKNIPALCKRCNPIVEELVQPQKLIESLMDQKPALELLVKKPLDILKDLAWDNVTGGNGWNPANWTWAPAEGGEGGEHGGEHGGAHGEGGEHGAGGGEGGEHGASGGSGEGGTAPSEHAPAGHE
jgi:uncharacterized Zn-binding protein involved in type VI secretion